MHVLSIPARFTVIGTVALLISQQLWAQSARSIPDAYATDSAKNFIRTWNATAPDSVPNTFRTRPLKDVKQTTAYFDSLGRTLQTVVKKGSYPTGGTAVDMISMVEYDEWGREQYKYLPTPANSTGGNSSISDGLFKLNPFEQQAAFYNSSSSGSPLYGQGETFFYSQTVYETSPLKRVNETAAPGNSWTGSMWQSAEADRRSVKMKYWVNSTIDSVWIWKVTDVANNFATYDTAGAYAYNQLYKNITVDEHGTQIIEFKNLEGLIILKKIQLTAETDTGTGKGYAGWLCTYYIYDDLNNLRCVIQPEGVNALMANSWQLTATLLNEQCFRYEYDGRNRMVRKKVPGAGPVWMVYDARDRLVLSQDSVMRSNHDWLYSQYDSLNRLVATGQIADGSHYNDLSYHAVRADTSIAYPWSGVYTVDTLTKIFYDDYTWRTGQGNPLSATRSTTNDSYLQAASNTTWPYPQNATTQSTQTKGMVTGTKTKVLETSTYLYSVSFYDDKTRVIQIQSTNISAGTDIVTTQYAWTGVQLLSIIENQKAGINAQTSKMFTQVIYDSLFRPVKIEKKTSNSNVNSGVIPASWTTIVQSEYDALGQLKKKELGEEPLDSLVYDYNIRGWMLGMNRAYVKDTTSTSHYFGFDVGYDKTAFTINGNTKSYAAAQYNGNIEGMLWKSTGDDQLRKYDFTYDAANRIISADFNQLTSNSFSKNAGIDFSVYGMSYDANGNILTMNQRGWKVTGSETIDSLLYTYTSSSNRLLNVLDQKNDTATRLGDFRSSELYMDNLSLSKNTTATDYTYDGNGNMNLDNNKDISFIHYNYLNLPDSIVVTNKGHITYTYDAAGNKLKKTTTEGANVTTTLYLFGNFVNDTLQYLPQEEGRVRFKLSDSTLQYDYFIKDHLGNVRTVLTEEKDTSFYPAATLETAQLANERLYYSKVDSGRVLISGIPDYPSDTYTDPNDYTQQLNGNGVKIGTGIVLKVMAGDKFNLHVSSWWKSNNTPGTPVNPLNDLLAMLNTSVAAVSSTHFSSTELSASDALSPGATSFLNDQTGYNTSRPKAFVNWILFDEQFNYVANSSGFEQVGASNSFTSHDRTDEEIVKNGYLYIYVSNETPNIDVFFDNLQVTHIRGPILEETHYYPFGLTMAGISSKALNFGTPNNKYKYNGIEQNNDFDLNMYDAFYRNLDPQIGRFWQIDPKLEASQNISPYVAMDDNPVIKSDPMGDIAIIDDAVIGFFKGLFRKRDNFEGGAKTRLGSAFRSAGRHVANSAKIYGGLFATDGERSFFGQVGQVLSRLTWQLPNTIVGFVASHGANMLGTVNSVDYGAGATVLNYGQYEFGAFTLGSYIIGDKTIKADPNNQLFQHEYGHYLQSETLGPAYLFAIAIPSLINAAKEDYFGHMNYYTEIGASTRAHNYFNRTIDGFNGWDYYYNPVKPDAKQKAIDKRKRDMPHPGDAGPANKQINLFDKYK